MTKARLTLSIEMNSMICTGSWTRRLSGRFSGSAAHGWQNRVIVQGRNGTRCAALRNDFTRAALAPPALGGNAQFKLDVIKTHACAYMAGNVAV